VTGIGLEYREVLVNTVTLRVFALLVMQDASASQQCGTSDTCRLRYRFLFIAVRAASSIDGSLHKCAMRVAVALSTSVSVGRRLPAIKGKNSNKQKVYRSVIARKNHQGVFRGRVVGDDHVRDTSWANY
jgi:hypothetical protein